MSGNAICKHDPMWEPVYGRELRPYSLKPKSWGANMSRSDLIARELRISLLPFVGASLAMGLETSL